MEEMKISQILDLRGVSCPLNYLKAKLKLEKMDAGEVLEILLDDGEPIVRVPRSIKDDGHQILEVIQIEKHFKVLMTKGNKR